MSFYDDFLTDFLVEADLEMPIVNDYPLLKLFSPKMGDGNAVQRPILMAASRNVAGGYAASLVKHGYGSSTAKLSTLKWVVPVGEVTSTIHVPDKDIAQSDGGMTTSAANAMVAYLRSGVEEFIQYVARRFGRAQSLGTAVYEDTGKTLTFTNASDAGPLVKGTPILIANGDGSSGSHAQVGSVGLVNAVNVDTGVVTVATTSAEGTPANPGSWTETTHNVFEAGAFDPGDPSSQILGIADILPAAVSTATIAGLVRAGESRTCGNRSTTGELANKASVMSRITANAAKGQKTCGWKMKRTRYAIVSPNVFDGMANAFEGRLLGNQGEDAAYGKSYIGINTVVGSIRIVSEPTAPDSLFRVIDPSGVDVYTSNGKWHTFVKNKGSILTQLADGANNHVIRPALYSSVVWNNPSHHGVGPTGL